MAFIDNFLRNMFVLVTTCFKKKFGYKEAITFLGVFNNNKPLEPDVIDLRLSVCVWHRPNKPRDKRICHISLYQNYHTQKTH